MFQMAQQHEANEKSLRSVFVGNIPYEATEDNLKEIFSQVGTVLSFRLVYDRETNKPKGYGFCEYQDQETAKSAMRTLSGYELSGRSLRVDTATSDKTDELKTMGPTGKVVPEVTPYGAPCPPDNAPQAISQAIASLPPEQMFDLMKQMKNSILGKPNEARRLLEENPQLSFALLQTLIVMRVLDPTVAQNMLHTVRPSNNRAESRQFRPRPPPPERYIPDHGAPSPIGRQQPPIGRAPSLPPVECPQPPVGRPQPPVEYPQPPLEYPQPPVGRQQPPIGRAPSQPPIGRAPSQPPIGRAPSQPPVGRPQPPVRRQQPPVGRAPSLPRTPDIGGQTDQEDLIRQVMMLSDDQIASLPEEQRNTLLLFKQQYKHSVM